MTIICALHDPETGTWWGCDSQRTDSGTVIFMARPKFKRIGAAMVGMAGWARGFQALDTVEPASTPERLALNIRKAMREDGFARTPYGNDEGQVEGYGASFIFAFPDGVFDCDGGFAVSAIPAGELFARGSGRDNALGAAFALDGVAEPRTIVQRAVEAAVRLDTGCGGRIWIERVEADVKKKSRLKVCR